MNNTNRALNRTVILVTGVVLLVLGAAAVVLGSVEAVVNGWADVAPTVYDSVDGFFAETPLGTTGASWAYIVVIALCVLAIVLLLIFIFRQGHGHTGELVDRTGAGVTGAGVTGAGVTGAGMAGAETPGAGVPGGVFVAAAVAEQSLQAALDARPELVSSRVTTYAVRKRPVLKISATARRGVSPRAVSEIVDEYLRSFDRLLGDEIPVLLHLSGGIRTRSTAPTRVQ